MNTGRPSELVRPSTVPTSLKNDLMFDEIDCEDIVGLTKHRAHRNFSISNESFMLLVDREYDLRAATDKRFRVVVSKACFRYVMTIHLYSRYAQLRNLRGSAEHDEIMLLTYMQGNAYTVPPAIDAYARSIGDFTDASGKHYKFELPVGLMSKATSVASRLILTGCICLILLRGLWPKQFWQIYVTR